MNKKMIILLFAGITLVSTIFYVFHSHNKGQSTEILDVIKINDCEDISEWKLSWGMKINLDTVNYVEGEKGIKLTADDGGTGHYYEFKEPMDISNHHTECDIYIYNITNLNRIVISYYEQNQSKQVYLNSRTLYHSLDAGWNRLHLSRANFVYENGADYSSWMQIKRIRLSICANENSTVSATFDNIRAVPDFIRGGVLSLRFDDSWVSYYTEAKTRMDVYGYPGIAATITGLIQENRTHLLSLSDLREMQDSGWDIISHCHNSQGRLDTKNELERRLELSESKLWLLENGFERGAEYIALPNHAWDDEIIELVKEYYSGCMTHTGGHETVPPSDPYKIIVMPIQKNTSVDDVKSWIDDCVENDSWLILLFHNLVKDPIRYTEYDIEDFQNILDYINEKNVRVETMSAILNGN